MSHDREADRLATVLGQVLHDKHDWYTVERATRLCLTCGVDPDGFNPDGYTRGEGEFGWHYMGANGMKCLSQRRMAYHGGHSERLQAVDPFWRSRPILKGIHRYCRPFDATINYVETALLRQMPTQHYFDSALPSCNCHGPATLPNLNSHSTLYAGYPALNERAHRVGEWVANGTR